MATGRRQRRTTGSGIAPHSEEKAIKEDVFDFAAFSTYMLAKFFVPSSC